MVATLCLFGWVLVTAQPADRGEWLLTPRYTRGQELIYHRGVYTEETISGNARCSRSYRLDHRVFVLDVTTQGSEVALFTSLRPREATGESGRDAAPLSIRLEVVRLDGQGRVTSAGAGALAAPIDGPPTLECGHLVELPRGRVSLGQAWPAGEEGRPPRTWQVAGSETIAGVACVKLVGVQQSDDWEHPRADHVAWHRDDTVWLQARDGVAQKVERIVERRDPGHVGPTQRSVLTYELASSIEYPSKHFDVRKTEIVQAKDFWDRALPCLSTPARHTAELDALAERLSYHLDHAAPTPYREAILRVQRRVEAARRGEAFVVPEPPAPLIPAATVGKPAPDFAVPDFLTRDSVQLRSWVGKPILLVFYSPTSERAPELLRFAQALHEAHPQDLTILGLALTEDADLARKQRGDLKLAFPLLNGTGLRLTYEVKSTPKIVLIDAEGLVHSAYVGWGPEVQEDVLQELKALAPKK